MCSVKKWGIAAKWIIAVDIMISDVNISEINSVTDSQIMI